MEVARISAPEAVVRRIGDDGAGLLGLLHDRINLFPRADEMPDGDGAKPRLRRVDLGVLGKRGRRIERQGASSS